jgi:NADH-quinone oxidoreductase subunit A
MLQAYLPIVVLVVISTTLAVAIVVLGHLFGPHQPTQRKSEPYESGMRPIGPAMRRMPVRFYLVAVLFILFDIEVVFFLPWAVTLQSFIKDGLGVFAFVEMVVFIAILLVGYLWLWQKGALEWE